MTNINNRNACDRRQHGNRNGQKYIPKRATFKMAAKVTFKMGPDRKMIAFLVNRIIVQNVMLLQ